MSRDYTEFKSELYIFKCNETGDSNQGQRNSVVVMTYAIS